MLWIKAILYRVVRMAIVFLSGYFVLGDPTAAISIMSVDVIAATIFYYYFDRWWDSIELFIKRWLLKWKYRDMN